MIASGLGALSSYSVFRTDHLAAHLPCGGRWPRYRCSRGRLIHHLLQSAREREEIPSGETGETEKASARSIPQAKSTRGGKDQEHGLPTDERGRTSRNAGYARCCGTRPIEKEKEGKGGQSRQRGKLVTSFSLTLGVPDALFGEIKLSLNLARGSF